MVLGQLLAGRFLLVARAGAGGMGIVYRAEDRLEGGLVAVKVLQAEGPTERARFARECSLLASLQDPAIVGYVDQGTTERGEPYLAMEWIEGTSLSQRLATSGLDIESAVNLVRKLAQAVAALHRRGIVHRDLKPSNVLLHHDDPRRPKLLDLGVVRPAEGGFTLTGAIIGTPGYMAPEQARGEHDVDARADVFALGCLLYKCVTGRAPFFADDPVATLLHTVLDEPPPLCELAPHAPEALASLLARLLSKDRRARPADAVEVSRLLAELDLGGVRGHAPLPPSGLTEAERRVTCLVVGRFVERTDDAEAPTLDVATRLSVLQPVLDRMQARFDILAGGTLVVSFRDAVGSAGDLAARGARCALALRSACPDVRLVVATGSAVDTGRTMVGVTIDRAAGMLGDLGGSAAHAIALDKTTATLVEARFVVEPTRHGVALVSERESEGLRTLLGQPSTFVGRSAELALLRSRFDACVVEGRAEAVLVTAPAGVGKSRLRHELVTGLVLERPDLGVWLMRGDPLSVGAPFGLVAPALRRAAGILDDEPAERQRARLTERVARTVVAPEVARVADFLGEIAAVRGSVSHEMQAARRDAALMGDQIRRAFADFVTAECERRPLLVVVEDLQWGDLPSVRLLESALADSRDRALFVLALGRPEVRDRFPRLWSEQPPRHMALGLLSRDAAHVLVRDALGSGVSNEIVGRIVERADGNAFFLEELIRAVAAGGVDALPETVIATVQARLDALPPESRRVLRAASVFGHRFSSGDVAALLGREPGIDVELSLGELAAGEILVRREAVRSSDGPPYSFRHALVREAAYAMLTDDDRVLGHRLAAERLERNGSSDTVGIAEHYERGGTRARAAPLWAQAARQALEGNDLDQVVERVERAVACGAAGPMLGALHVVAAEAYLWRGETAVAEHEAHAALAQAPRGSPDYCKAAEVGATAAGRRGNHQARAEFVRAVLDLAPESDREPHRLVTLAQCSIQLVFAGDLAGADQLLRRIDGTGSAALDDDAAAAGVLRARAWRAMSAGDPGTYGAMMLAAAERFSRVGDLRNACVQRVNVCYAESTVGQFEQAARGYRQVVDTAFRLGLAGVAAVARHNLGLALAMLGQLDAAEREETLALQAFELQSDRRLQAMSLVYLALIAAERRAWPSAEQLARRALELLPVAGPPRAQALGLLARVLVASERSFEALGVAREAHELLERLGGVDEGEALIRLAYAEALGAVGLREEANGAIERARDRLHERASRITSSTWRESFLGRVPENVRTLALATQWLGRAEG